VPAARVAVIVPLFNAEAYVAETINSILAQSYEDFVVMVVDDGSTDRSRAVVEGIPDERVFLHAQPNSGGPATPRNVGIRLTTSEYVALFDSDDLMLPGKLAESVQALDACPQAGFVISNFERIDERGQLLTEDFLAPYGAFQEIVAAHRMRDEFVYLPPDALFKTLCKQNFFGTSSVVARRATLDVVGGFDETLKNSDDRDMWFRLTREFGGAYIPRPLHQYRWRQGSISSRGGVVNAEGRIKVIQRQLQHELSTTARRDLRARVSEHYTGLGYALRKQGQRVDSAAAFLRAFTYAPRLRWLMAAGKSLAGRS
jgi:glycosyltransferase involved in cell wall biosynthesis